MKVEKVEFKRSCEGIDPRTGVKQLVLVASDDLEITLEGDKITALADGVAWICPFSNVHAVKVAVPAAKPAQQKEKVSK